MRRNMGTFVCLFRNYEIMQLTTRINIMLAIVFILLVGIGFAGSEWLGQPQKTKTYEQTQKMIERIQAQNWVKKSTDKPKTKVQNLETKSWEVTLQAQPVTVNLKLLPEYHDKLASYAYDYCLRRYDIAPWVLHKHWYDYSCQQLVKTWQSENGWWNKDAVGVTHDGGLCQLNPRYHSAFIHSSRYSNPLSQIEYCQWVWEDAARKGSMPWYAYDAITTRADPYVQFLQP